ncbi:MAG: ABC transporter ATP-binding protein [Prolixibacteraceae bacterium]|nr:ABC transporter ATP-binding protein [Prolixibacteraceae bacterium]
MNISIQDLTKIYGNGHKALKSVNLEIENGMFGLLGANGAGKSTLMRILVSLMKPSSGKVLVNGKELIKNRKDIRAITGYLPQDFSAFPKLKAWEFLDYSARLGGVKDKRKRRDAIDEMLEEVGLFEVRERFANKLSGGMKRRLGIAQALIGEPQIIIVDEPTTGLDPDERIRFRNLLTKISSNDVVIILSTHIVGDISSTCNQMALLKSGKVVYNGSPEALINKADGKVWRIHASHEQFDEVNVNFNVISTIPSVGGWELDVVADRVNGYNAEQLAPNLEHAYVYYMEHQTEKIF